MHHLHPPFPILVDCVQAATAAVAAAAEAQHRGFPLAGEWPQALMQLSAFLDQSKDERAA